MIARTKHHGPPIDARIALGSDCDSLVKFNVTRSGCDSDREESPKLVKRHTISPGLSRDNNRNPVIIIIDDE